MNLNNVSSNVPILMDIRPTDPANRSSQTATTTQNTQNTQKDSCNLDLLAEITILHWSPTKTIGDRQIDNHYFIDDTSNSPPPQTLNDVNFSNTECKAKDKAYSFTQTPETIKKKQTRSHQDTICYFINPVTNEGCDKHCLSYKSLTIHMKSHMKKRSYTCETCNKAFSRKDNLVQHEHIHTGKKPYKCTTCGQEFNHPSNLRQHKKIHNKEKDHECTTCGKRFNHPSSLTKHKKTHAATPARDPTPAIFASRYSL